MDSSTYSYNDVKNDAELIIKLQLAKNSAPYSEVEICGFRYQISREESERLEGEIQRGIDEADIRIKTWRIR